MTSSNRRASILVAREHILGLELARAPGRPSNPSARCVITGTQSDAPNEEAFLSLDDEILSKHLLFLGEIGSGKTNAIQQVLQRVQKALTDQDIVFVFDTKGDFRREFCRLGVDVTVSNDADSMDANGENYWNIFREINPLSYEDDIQELARSLFHERTTNAAQPFFPNAARDIFAAILLHLYRRAQLAPNEVTLDNAFLRSFCDRVTAKSLREMLQQPENADLTALVSYIGSDTSDQSLGVLSELQQMVREVFIGNFKKAGTLSTRELVRKKEGRIVFIEYDISMGNILAPIYRVLFDFAIKEALSRKRSAGNVWFFIDEFRLIPHLQHIDNGVNFGRSLGVKFIIGVQNIGQVYYAYSEPLAKSLFAGFLTTIAFRVNDLLTREFIKQRYGMRRIQEVTRAVGSGQSLQTQTITTEVIEDTDILQLRIGQAIVGLPQAAPFQFQFGEYRRNQ